MNKINLLVLVGLVASSIVTPCFCLAGEPISNLEKSVIDPTEGTAQQSLSPSNVSKKTSCKLTLGVSNWFPYQHITSNGLASGKQIELIKQIASKVGCKLSYVSTSFPDGLQMLKSGSLDFQMNASPTVERRKYAYLSKPYRREFLLLYSTRKYLKKCQTMSLTALINDGFKLGVQPGLVYGEELTRIQHDPTLNRKLYYIKNNQQHMQLINEFGLDGVIDDPVVVSYRSIKNTTGHSLSACAVVVSQTPISLIFSKKTVSQEIVNKFDQAIVKIKASPSYRKNWSW